jgi:gluconolactonase
MGPDATFRTDVFNGSFFNPTNTEPPFFQVFDEEFLDILGEDASIHVIARNDSYAFAHEAPIYVPETDELFFCSNAGGNLGMSDWDHNNAVFKINMNEVETALASSNGTVNTTVTRVCSFFFRVI